MMDFFFNLNKQTNKQQDLNKDMSNPLSSLTWGSSAVDCYRKVVRGIENPVNGERRCFWIKKKSSKKGKLGHSVIVLDLIGDSTDTEVSGLVAHLGVSNWPIGGEDVIIHTQYDVGMAHNIVRQRFDVVDLGVLGNLTVEECLEQFDESYSNLFELNGYLDSWTATLNCRSFVKEAARLVGVDHQKVIVPTEYAPIMWDNFLLPVSLSKERLLLLGK